MKKRCRRIALVVLLTSLGACGGGAPPAPSGAYVVVAADALAEAARAYANYRGSQGYRTEVLTASTLTPGQATRAALVEPIRAALRAARQGLPAGAPTFLLLLGDAPADDESFAGQLPALPCTNSEGLCFTDGVYADLDGDDLPDVAVGRIPARTEAQALSFLAKLQAHEASYEPGLWNRRVSIYTGEPGFDPQIDAAIEYGVMEGLKRLSHAFDFLGAYNNPRSDFYYTPFDAKVLDLYNDGAVVVVYVGHGSSGESEGLALSDVPAVQSAHRLPLALFIACSNGDYLGARDSLAEALLWKDRGPFATVGAADVSHPYGNGVLVYELMRIALDEQPATAGELFLTARRALVEHEDEFRRVLDALAQTELSPAELSPLRRENIYLYNLFGDPASSMQYPRGYATVAPEGAVSLSSGKLSVAGTTPGLLTGEALVTLEVPLDVMREPLMPVDPASPDPATVQANWARAMDKVVASARVPVQGGRFRADLSWSATLPDRTLYVKVYAEGGGTDAFGFVPVH